MFLYIVPLKQGLKHADRNLTSAFVVMFLYIVPLKQGLKHNRGVCYRFPIPVFIHSSIKTRIETLKNYKEIEDGEVFLYIVPLKQGLKLELKKIMELVNF